MALAKNTRTGKIVSVPAHYIGHSVLGKNLSLISDEVSAAPKEKKKPAKYSFKAKDIFAEDSADLETEGQPAPETNINEIEENEDGN